MKQHDTAPPYKAYFSKIINGVVSPYDLNGATVKIRMVNSLDGTVKLNDALCVIESAINGIARYDWQVGDTDIIGDYKVIFKVIDSTGTKTFPSEGFEYLTIEKNI